MEKTINWFGLYRDKSESFEPIFYKAWNIVYMIFFPFFNLYVTCNYYHFFFVIYNIPSSISFIFAILYHFMLYKIY